MTLDRFSLRHVWMSMTVDKNKNSCESGFWTLTGLDSVSDTHSIIWESGIRSSVIKYNQLVVSFVIVYLQF
ncbi:hypothetical protein L2E82_14193 [Cichorium intybus]|uniref:Uncharacterized protein n=1 Tax=Cichorium intybus TaxID=13427 RepID=A0ACB9EZF3_CICIN|nr:hypothetical protein L2E82_14193 [Cichorium intybus]